jgi:cyclase
MKKASLFLLFFVLSISFLSLTSAYQEEIVFQTVNVNENVYCLYGAGGNIGILKGEEGVLLVDSQYAKYSSEILEEIRKISPDPILYLINTHYHGDHTDGNPILGKGAKIIGHINCKNSMLKGKKPEEAAENLGIPEETFESEMTINFGNETVKLLYLGPGHTSGDAVVVFEKAGVIHAGDLFFHKIPPYIDVNDGSGTGNWVKIIGILAERYPDFKVIPGHGEVATMKEFYRFADYLRYLHDQVAAAIESGKTKEQAVASIDLSNYDYIQDQGEFLTKKRNIELVYDELTRK